MHHNVSICDPNSLPLPKMATTTSPFKISMEPREMKYSAGITSPAWTKVSPGGACVVLNFIAKARKQPLVDPLKALQFCSNVRFRCKQMSACKHSGNPFSTCNEIKQANVINDTAPVMCVCKNKESGEKIEYAQVFTRHSVCDSVTHSIHVNAVRVGPSMLKVLLQFLPEWVGDLVETDKFPNPQHLSVVTCGARVQPLDDG